MANGEYKVVDKVTRETGEILRETDAVLAWDDDAVYVLESVE